MPYSKNIVYLSKNQYNELITNQSITVDGVTIEYNENDIYVTPQAEPVTDVKINGTSIVQNNIANIPIANANNPGVMKINISYGHKLNDQNVLLHNPAISSTIKGGIDPHDPIVSSNQHESVFYGLSKVAGEDLASVSNITLGTYPDASKAAIQNMLGITDLLSTEETTTAIAAHALNSTFMMNGKLHRATAAIAIGDAVEVGTNCEVVKADEVFVKNTDYATGSNAGVVKVSSGRGIEMNSANQLQLIGADNAAIKAETDSRKPITPLFQHSAVFYGLSKVAGVDLANETVTLGTYPETSKTAIRSLIGAAAASDVTVSDVQVNGTSVLANGVANVPAATNNNQGTVLLSNSYGITTYGDNNVLGVRPSNEVNVKAGTERYYPLVPYRQHESTFYGLAKAAGADMASSSNAVGTYTETAKTAIRTMLGAASTNIVAVQDEQPTDTDTKVWLPGTQAAGIEVPTYAEFQALDAAAVKDVQINGTSIVNSGIANIPKATSESLGVIKVSSGLNISSAGSLYIDKAISSYVKNGVNEYKPIVPYHQHEAVFYGLAKVAGTDLANETVTLGTYPATASAAIRSMLGTVGDVQVEGTSIVSEGVATIPRASAYQYGTVKVKNGGGTNIDSTDGTLITYPAGQTHIKAGTATFMPITPVNQHYAIFYGLAKAAGDTTQSASSNTVGTYTTEAKSAIQSMLGIDLQSIASEVEIPLVETVSGTTPSISGQPNTRYVCGEVSTLSITPPAAGSIDVIFDSGSTAAVLTVPNTVRWPVWFDATALEADTTYEILITDGVYGSVMTWAN